MRTTKIDISKVYRSRCAAGHKALWHNKDFNGLPFDFLAKVDHLLSRFRETLYKETYTSDVVAGALSPYWAEKLGLQEGIPIAVGAFDAHMGAVGNGIKPGMLSRIVGTSTCDMVVAPYESMLADGKERLIKGICGQVDGSIIPGMYGLEAGQSAVGDIFANFRDWFSSMIMEGMKWNTTESRKQLNDRIYDMLTARAAALNIVPTSTGAAKAIGEVIPSLKGKIIGSAIRVPTPNGSLCHFVAELPAKQNICITEEVNDLFKKMSASKYKHILEYADEALVSSDVVGNPHSCVFDSKLTTCVGNNAIVVGWYDNEWGYSNRLLDVIKLIVK